MVAEITPFIKEDLLGVKLPKNMLREWKKATLSVRISPDIVVVQKKSQEPQITFAEMLEASRRAAKAAGITRMDVEKAIQWARRTKNKRR